MHSCGEAEFVQPECIPNGLCLGTKRKNQTRHNQQTNMFTRLLFLLALAITCHCEAQIAPPPGPSPVRGAFLAFIDDHATVFINGNKIFHGNLGTSRSPDTQLCVGDRLVAHLLNDGGPKQFLLVFASSDGNTIASFRASDFKIVPEVGVTDFTAEQYSKWTQAAKNLPGYKRDKRLDAVDKNYSQSVWGDLDKCTIACVITQKMFSARPK